MVKTRFHHRPALRSVVGRRAVGRVLFWKMGCPRATVSRRSVTPLVDGYAGWSRTWPADSSPFGTTVARGVDSPRWFGANTHYQYEGSGGRRLLVQVASGVVYCRLAEALYRSPAQIRVGGQLLDAVLLPLFGRKIIHPINCNAMHT